MNAQDHIRNAFGRMAAVIKACLNRSIRHRHLDAKELHVSLDPDNTDPGYRLGRLFAALERIQVGTYGICTDCGISIPPARLNAYPTAKRCVDCQSLSEHHR